MAFQGVVRSWVHAMSALPARVRFHVTLRVLRILAQVCADSSRDGWAIRSSPPGTGGGRQHIRGNISVVYWAFGSAEAANRAR
jgi:hypothetical protein